MADARHMQVPAEAAGPHFFNGLLWDLLSAQPCPLGPDRLRQLRYRSLQFCQAVKLQKELRGHYEGLLRPHRAHITAGHRDYSKKTAVGSSLG